ncbi:MAG: flavoprotein [Planctomycetota bacterium]
MSSEDQKSEVGNRQIILAVTGGIACYKSADLCSKLVQSGARVDVCMTEAARKFVTPLTFEALSGNAVRTDLWEQTDPGDTQHIGLTENADLLLIAPATMHMLCKCAAGLCDDIVSLLVAASACPVMWCPSMNTRMWDNPATQNAVDHLRDRGHLFTGPEAGWLACRNTGKGRMSEVETIVEAVETNTTTRRA